MTGLLINVARAALALAGIKREYIRQGFRGLLWKEGDFAGVLNSGAHWRIDLSGRDAVETVSARLPWLIHDRLDLMVKSGLLPGEVRVLNLDSHQRALVWVDGRFDCALGPGLHAWWTGIREVRCELFDVTTDEGRLEHPDLAIIAEKSGDVLTAFTVSAGSKVAFFRNGEFRRLFGPGRYAWWNGSGDNRFAPLDERETTLDIGGQELLTADKLTVRLNASLSIRVADGEKSLVSAVDSRQALYREAQLALRAMVGGRDLDSLLAEKDRLTAELAEAMRAKAAEYGYAVTSFGVRDIILPGEIRAILIKVTEAKKAAEAAMIARREETAAMRHQANTARMLAENPVLMRLRELETIEKIASGNKLKFILGEKGLADKVRGLL